MGANGNVVYQKYTNLYVIECMQDAGKEDYLRPSERIGLDWIGNTLMKSVY